MAFDPHSWHIFESCLLVVIAFQVLGHFTSWFLRSMTDDGPSRHLCPNWAGWCCVAVALLIWTGTLFVAGLGTRRVHEPIASVIDMLLIVGMWSAIVSVWLIDFRFSPARVLRCVAAQFLIAGGATAFLIVEWGV